MREYAECTVYEEHTMDRMKFEVKVEMTTTTTRMPTHSRMNEREKYWMCAAYKWCWRMCQYEYNRCAFPLCHSYGYIGVCGSCFWFTPHVIGFDATIIEGWNPKDSNTQTYTYWSLSYTRCQPNDFQQWLLNFYITFIRSADDSTIQRKNNAIVFCLNVWDLFSSLRSI